MKKELKKGNLIKVRIPNSKKFATKFRNQIVKARILRLEKFYIEVCIFGFNDFCYGVLVDKKDII